MVTTEGSTFAEVSDSSAGNQPKDPASDLLVDEIWKELGGQVTREQVLEVVTGTAAEFESAIITTFVPIFIRRRAVDRLRRMLDEKE